MNQFSSKSQTSHPSLVPGPLPLALVGMAIMCLVWLVLLAGGEENIARLTIFSSKLKVLSGGNDGLIAMLIAVSVGLVGLSSAVLPSRQRLLMVLILLSFGLSEVVIPWLNLGAFIVRYLIIVVLATVGGVVLLRSEPSKIGWLRWVALGFLAWCFINLSLNGPKLESITMLPIQIVLVIGVLFGAREIYQTPKTIVDAATVFAGIGVLMTGIHLIALLTFPDSFLKGRFTSILPLPTSFGNNYVLFVGAMLWRLLIGGKWLVTAVTAASLAVGVLMLLLSGTRNALLVMAFVLLVLLLASKARVTIIAGLALIIGVLIAAEFLLETNVFRHATERAGNTQSLEIREQVWKFTWEHIQEKPIIGYGLGVGSALIATDLPSWNRLNAHNAYLGIWLQLGVVGVVSVVVLYLGTMVIGGLIVFSSGIPRDITAAVALPLATLTGLFIGGMFEENLSNRGGLQQVIWGLDICMIQAVWAQVRSIKMSRILQRQPTSAL